MPILHRFRDINTYLPKIKTSRDLNHAHLGDSSSLSQDYYFSRQPVHKIWRFYLQPFHRYLGGGGVKFQNRSRDPGHAFLGIVGRPKANTRAYNRTKFDDCSFSRSKDISGGVKF